MHDDNFLTDFDRFCRLCYLDRIHYCNFVFQYVNQRTLVHHRPGGDWNKSGISSAFPVRRKSCICSTRPRHSISRRLLRTRKECPTLASLSNSEWSKMETASSWLKPSIFWRLRPQRLLFILPGQGWVLQSRDLSFTPLHSSPPLVGGGLVQVRVLVCDPRPQDFVQGPHCFHPLQFPSTEKKLILLLIWNLITKYVLVTYKYIKLGFIWRKKICSDICLRTLSVSRCKQFLFSKARGKLWALRNI